MIKTLMPETWFLDFEWVPDPETGRRVHGLDASVPDDEVVEAMWREGGATDEEPQPYLKTLLCRIVSTAVLVRRSGPDRSIRFEIHSVPRLEENALPEKELIGRFLSVLESRLDRVGQPDPQLVGFNVVGSDIPILVQRAMANRIRAPKFASRPDKPWTGRDYFARGSDYLVELREVLGGWARSPGTLHEYARAFGIPGKLEHAGSSVVDLWREGRVREIIEYNQLDVLTTYMVWLRAIRFSGLLSADAADREEKTFRAFLDESLEQMPHLGAWLRAWDAG